CLTRVVSDDITLADVALRGGIAVAQARLLVALCASNTAPPEYRIVEKFASFCDDIDCSACANAISPRTSLPHRTLAIRAYRHCAVVQRPEVFDFCAALVFYSIRAH